MVEIVDVVVLLRDLPGCVLVDIHERSDDPADELRDALAKLRQHHVVLERRVWRELACLFCHGCRVVAHPLELVAHVVQRQQVAQVAGDRVLGRDHGGDHRGCLALDLVDLAVIEDHLEGCFGVVFDQRHDRGTDLLLDHRAHPQNVVLDLGDLAVVGARTWWVGGKPGPTGSIGSAGLRSSKLPPNASATWGTGVGRSFIGALPRGRTGRRRSPR